MTDLEKLELKYPIGYREIYYKKSEIQPVGAWFIVGVETYEVNPGQYDVIDIWERFI